MTLAILGEHLMIIELLEVTYFSNLARFPSMPRNVPWSVSVPIFMVLVEDVFKCHILVDKCLPVLRYLIQINSDFAIWLGAADRVPLQGVS